MSIAYHPDIAVQSSLAAGETGGALDDRGATGRQDILETAREELMLHAMRLGRAALELDDSFLRALDLIVGCSGRVVVSGIGKSGLVARKIAATLACTGSPAFFLHPAEAAHGDLGCVTAGDVAVVVSYSGETSEVLWILPHLRRLGVPVLAITGSAHSALARAAAVVLRVPTDVEPSGSHTIPTASVLVSQALGDALALAAMRARGFAASELVELHPGSPPTGGPRG